MMRNNPFLISAIFLALVLTSCARKMAYNDPIPAHESFTVDSELLQEERTINVWLPRNYDELENLKVLYMPDGGLKEDFPHIANTIAALVESGQIEPLILVGIENTDRHRDLTGASEQVEDAKYCPLTDGAKNFRAFILEELVPMVAMKYRVSGEKGLLGESLAGLFVMETFLEHPMAFDHYIAMDPSLWWNNHALQSSAADKLKHFSSSNISLWFAGSSALDISKYTQALAQTLSADAPTTLRWHYSDEPSEKHNTIFRATKEKALLWTFAK